MSKTLSLITKKRRAPCARIAPAFLCAIWSRPKRSFACVHCKSYAAAPSGQQRSRPWLSDAARLLHATMCMQMQTQTHRHKQEACPSASKVRHDVCEWKLLQIGWYLPRPVQDSCKLPLMATYWYAFFGDESVVTSTTRDLLRYVSEQMLRSTCCKATTTSLQREVP